MPYAPTSETKGITASAVTVALQVSPRSPWTAGQTITLKATVESDGAPYPSVIVAFYAGPEGGIWHQIGTSTTDSNGIATLTWTIPWKMNTDIFPSHILYFIAGSQGAWSDPLMGVCAYPTRISISAPDRVAPGQKFTISGKLEYESEPDVWSPLAGRTISLFYNTTKIADVTTGADGSYSAEASIPESGTYTLKASYAGEHEHPAFAPALAEIGLEVTEVPKPLIASLAVTVLVAILVLALAVRR